nr:synaptobrevin, longin-like domain protein [Tanacetum cinerariifolium]
MNDLILDYCRWHKVSAVRHELALLAKKFLLSGKIKQSNDVTRLQALVDKEKVVVAEATIRDALHLDHAEAVDCLPNEEIFATLARMGYEKPSTKLTFYKAFFSSQWKFLIYTILQSVSAKRTSWNEFSSAMASAVICLATGRKFNFSKYIFESLIAREPENQANAETKGDEEEQDTAAEETVTVAVDADHSIPSPTSLTLPPQQSQDIPSTSHVQSPPTQHQSPPSVQPHGTHFPLSLLQEALDACTAIARRVKHLEHDKVAQDLEIQKLKSRVQKLEKANKADIYHIDMDHAAKVLSMQEDEPEIQEAVEVVTTAKLITEVVAAVSETISAAAVVQADIPTALVNAAAVMTTAAPVKVAIPSTRRRRGVVIRDPEEESSAKTPTETTSKDKGKDIDWETAIEHVKQRAKEEPFIQRYQFLLKTKEQIEEEENKAITLINETPAQKAAKRRRLNKEAGDVEELKQHLEIVPDEDDDVFTEATPLARKVPIVDYEIIHIDNKPRYKIIRAHDTHQLYRSFITMLKNFDKEDLETL